MEQQKASPELSKESHDEAVNNGTENDKASNDENIRINQGYKIIDSAVVGQREFVLGVSPNAPTPYATWVRNLPKDARTDGENFYWGHYFGDKDAAQKDFQRRIADMAAKEQPSVSEQLKRRQDTISHTHKPDKDAGLSEKTR